MAQELILEAKKKTKNFGASYPCQLAYCGAFDITGFSRPASYFGEVVFESRKDPYITVQNPYKFGEKII